MALRSIALFIIILNSAAVLGQFAEFSFSEKSIYKAEAILEGEQLTYEWHFTNTGDAPLIISSYKVECPCTIIEYSKEPIMPSVSSSIKLSFDSKGKMGWQYRKIQIYANTQKGLEEIEFRVKVINPK